MINFPTSLDSLSNPISSNPLNSPDHAAQHADINDAVEALEAKVGINGSAVTTSHDYKLARHLKNTYRISATGGDFTTVAACVTYLGTLSQTDGVRIVVDGGQHSITDTVIIDLPFTVYFEGSGSFATTFFADTGLLNKNMFEIRSNCHFTKCDFNGELSGWKAGANGAFIKIDIDDVYVEITDFTMLTAKKAFHITAAASLFAFNFIVEDCTIGFDVNAPGKTTAIDTEVGNVVNCDTMYNLVNSALGDTYLNGIRFFNEVGQVSIAYNGTNYTYSNFSILNCEHNHVGTFSTGFDFTLSRDADIEILGCVGIEASLPHAKINLVGNATVTAVATDTWTKATFTNTSSYNKKWSIASNRMTYMSNHTRDVVMHLNGSMTVPNTGTYYINYGIVKNGNPGTIYGQSQVTCDTNGRAFTFATVVYLQNVAINDYFELWIFNVGSANDPIVQNMNWFAEARA